MLHLFLLRKTACLLNYLKTAQNPAPGCYYLHNFADDPVEKSHQLACGQLDLLFQLVHRLVLEANSQEKSLENGGSADVATGTDPWPFKWHQEPVTLLTKAKIWIKIQLARLLWLLLCHPITETTKKCSPFLSSPNR